MGCDIHGTIEKKVGDKWVMVTRLGYDSPSTNRHYPRFAALAGVRGDGPSAKGIPEDVSESTQLYLEDYCGSIPLPSDTQVGDGHSFSWVPLAEAVRIYRDTLYPGEKRSEAQLRWPLDVFIPEVNWIEADELDQYRMVFWFDN